MPPVRSLAAFVVIAACAAPIPTAPPELQAPPGAPVAAVETTGRTGLRVLGLTQGSIRACSGAYEPPTPTSPTRTTELACTGGVTGTATVGPDAGGGRSVTWQLETGESGRARL